MACASHFYMGWSELAVLFFEIWESGLTAKYAKYAKEGQPAVAKAMADGMVDNSARPVWMGLTGFNQGWVLPGRLCAIGHGNHAID
jgi:hypothetical protein